MDKTQVPCRVLFYTALKRKVELWHVTYIFAISLSRVEQKCNPPVEAKLGLYKQSLDWTRCKSIYTIPRVFIANKLLTVFDWTHNKVTWDPPKCPKLQELILHVNIKAFENKHRKSNNCLWKCWAWFMMIRFMLKLYYRMSILCLKHCIIGSSIPHLTPPPRRQWVR